MRAMHRRLPTLAQRAANIRGFAIAIIMALVFLTIPLEESPQLSASASASTYSNRDCQLGGAGALASTTDGDGSAGDPFQISTSDQLWAIVPCKGSGAGNETHFKLIADIDASEAGSGVPTSSPIGSKLYETPITADLSHFVFDGQGHEINYSVSAATDAGLFQWMWAGTFSNVVLRGSVTSTQNDSTLGSGALAGNVGNTGGATTVFQSISSHVSIFGLGSDNVGGLVGRVGLSPIRMENVINHGLVQGDNYVGGLIGYGAGRSNPELVNTENLGSISGQLYVGGLLGLTRDGVATVSSSINSGTVSATSGYVGGILGGFYTRTTVTITSTVNAGKISASAAANGLVGGIVGSSQGTLSLFSISNQAEVEGQDNVGGLIGSHTGDSLLVSRSHNAASVTGFSYLGGIAGELNGSAIASFFQVTNLGDLIGTRRIGGLVGILRSHLNVSQSSNIGSVNVTYPASGYNVGGLIGLVSGAVSFHISDSYNSGLLGPALSIGIIAPNGQSGSTLTRVAAFPAASQISPLDGLVGGTDVLASDVSSSYTFTTSRLVSTSTLAELKVVDTYVGWDFDTVWAFGGCDLNNGYPVLRWAHEGVTFFDQSCGVNSSSSPVVSSGGSGGSTPAPSSGGSGGSTPAPTRTPTAYSGPMLDAHKVVVQPGTANTVLGTRLQTIHTVTIDGLSATLVILTSTSLTITIPSSLNPGTYDLVVYSAHGKLTVNAKYLVVSGAADQDPEPSTDTGPEVEISRNFGVLLGFQWSARFIGNSRDLNQSQVRGVSESLEGYPAATTVVCWGYTAETTPGDWAIEHATERAESLCDAVAGLREDVKLYVRVRFGQSKFAAMRATMQFWESKQPI